MKSINLRPYEALALSEGRLSQIRRVVRPQPPEYIDALHGGELGRRAPYEMEDDNGNRCGYGLQDDIGGLWKCPFGKPGDVLAGKEAFAQREDVDCHKDAEKARHYCMYRASGGCPNDPNNWHSFSAWQSAAQMPKELVRFHLRIESVTVQRLAEMSESDAVACGAREEFHEEIGHGSTAHHRLGVECGYMPEKSFAKGFERAWDRHAKRGEKWIDSPWCWVANVKLESK